VRALSSPGPAFVGRISYSLYLWHYPFFEAFGRRPELSRPVVLLLETTLSVAAAAVSYLVVEQPVARWSARHLRA
jgi:peptidoglycan/LPS O-acetylase OafA/YrhL